MNFNKTHNLMDTNQIIHMNTILNTNNMGKTGTLSLIIGPMYSGKTSTILDLYRKYGFSKISTMVINYAEDTRYHDTKLSTHDKIMIPCVNTMKIRDIMTDDVLEDYDVFLINEGQFFPDLKICVMELVETYNKTVYVCGLDGDFKRNPFNQIVDLIPLCDEVVKKYSICKGCENGTRALFSHRTSNEKTVKVIGSSNYIPLCRKCYLGHNSYSDNVYQEEMEDYV